MKELITLIYKDSFSSGLSSKQFKTQNDLNSFLEDLDDEVCAIGEIVPYFILKGNIASIESSIIDKT